MRLRALLVLLALFVTASFTASFAALGQSAPAPVNLMFDLGAGPSTAGHIRLSPATPAYADAPGYGFEPALPGAPSSPFFSVRVPEGNYFVSVDLGNPTTATTTTLKAQSGELLLERLEVPAGQIIHRTFYINVRTSHLPKLPTNATGREEVTLDQFDRGNTRDWAGKLTLEFVGSSLGVQGFSVQSVANVATLFLAGDSTVTDRDGGGDVSWGQILPRFLKNVAVANHAQSGETLKSFANSLRLDKILSQIKPGDYLFIQFGHNDSKQSWPQTYADPETTYKAYLRVYIAEARLRHATPVLVIPMDRGDRTTGAPAHGHGGYPQAIREVAAEEHVPLIDLYKMSIALYESAGADAPKILADGTHSTAYGGYEFARCIVTGIKQNIPALAPYLADDFKPFDPTHPDSAATLNLAPLFSTGPPRTPRPATPGPGPL